MRQAYGQKQQRQTDHRRELARAAAPFEGVPLARRRPQARSVLECMRIIAAYPGTWEVGAALAAAAPPGTGAYYPREMDLVYGMSRAAYRSCRQVDAEWAEPTQWRYLQGLVRSADVTLRSEPYDFHHLRGFMDRHFDPDVQAALRDAFRRAAQELRIPLGLVLDSRELNWFAPDARNAVLGDGTYVRPLSGVYIDAESGVVKGTRARYQPRFSEGVAGTSKDGREYGGHLFVFLHARGPAYMQRVVLDVVQARPGVGEIITAMGAFGRIHDELGSAIHAFVYDKALSGRHFVDVMHHGVMPVTKLAHDGDKYDRGFVLAGLDDVQQKMTRKRLAVFPFGSCEHAVAAFNGGAWEVDRPLVGPATLLGRLERVATERVVERGRAAWCNTWRIDCRHGPHFIDIPIATALHANYLRLIDEDDPAFASLYGARNDTEAFHHWLKRTLVNSRASFVSARGVFFDLVCVALWNNAIAWWHHVGPGR